MSNINRRGFLQVLGAAGLSPFLPGMPARAAVAGGGVSASKALWASLYANSGSMSEFVGVAKNMGLSNTAIQGVSARSIGVRVALAASTETLTSTGAKTIRPTLSSSGREFSARQHVERAFEHCLSNGTDETADEEVENFDEESPIEDSGQQIG